MNRQEFWIIGIIFVVALVGATYSSDGNWFINNEKMALAKTKIDLTQAVYVAEQHANGKATRAEIEDTNGVPVYDVEILHGNKAENIRVDARTGKILDAQGDNTLLP